MLQTREEDIASLPEEYRTEVVAAADDRMAAVSDDEPWDDPEPADPTDAEGKPDRRDADDDGFAAWRATWSSAVAAAGSRGQEQLRETQPWGERGAQAVEEAFAHDRRLRLLRDAGRLAGQRRPRRRRNSRASAASQAVEAGVRDDERSSQGGCNDE